jgi:hypothetical protein
MDIGFVSHLAISRHRPPRVYCPLDIDSPPGDR